MCVCVCAIDVDNCYDTLKANVETQPVGAWPLCVSHRSDPRRTSGDSNNNKDAAVSAMIEKQTMIRLNAASLRFIVFLKRKSDEQKVNGFQANFWCNCKNVTEYPCKY